ncbi:hypothetical protein JCM11641_007051 [Rhodosporidiobolus odoratus]
MHATPFPSTFLAALMALALLSSQAEALPTHRSTSLASRRAHLAIHHPNHGLRSSPDGRTSLSGRAKRTETGDHAIVVDASTSGNNNGGIRGSTINLTSISKRQNDQQGALAAFARVVRSLFSTPPSSSAPSSPPADLPLTARARTASGNKRRTSAPSQHNERLPHNQRTVAAAGAKAPRTAAAASAQRALHSHVPDVKRARQIPSPAQAELEARDINYSDAAAQASAYFAAVAALGDSAPQTASPMIKAAVASPSTSAFSYASVVEEREESQSADLPPITVTVTLVPSGIDGAYIDAAGLASPTSTVTNPKATASSSSDDALSTFTVESPAPSAAVEPASTETASAGFARVKRTLEQKQAKGRNHARHVHAGGVGLRESKVVWTRVH